MCLITVCWRSWAGRGQSWETCPKWVNISVALLLVYIQSGFDVCLDSWSISCTSPTGDQGGNLSALAWKPLPFKTKTWAQYSNSGWSTTIQARQPLVLLELVKSSSRCPIKIMFTIYVLLTRRETVCQCLRCSPYVLCRNVNKCSSFKTCYGIKKI